jgi:hypothetical protein
MLSPAHEPYRPRGVRGVGTWRKRDWAFAIEWTHGGARAGTARGEGMSALVSHSHGLSHRAAWWQPDVIQLMDDHHLVACSGSPRARLTFASSIASYIDSMRGTEVCVFYGRYINDLESFCHQLERAVPGNPLDRRVDGLHGVTNLLRSRQAFPGKASARYRYYIWHDADVLLREDPRLFARVTDAMMGVAAESEYADDDLLLIQRTVFIGGAELERTIANPDGPFRTWFRDAPVGEPFWQTVTGLEAPMCKSLRIDDIV